MSRKFTIAAVLLILTSGCNKTSQSPAPDTFQPATGEFSLAQIKTWYAAQESGSNGTQTTQAAGQASHWRMPALDLNHAEKVTRKNTHWWVLALPGRPQFQGFPQGYRKLAFFKDTVTGAIKMNILEIIPDALYIQRKQRAATRDFTGRVFIFDQDYRLQRGLVFQKGTITGKIRPRDTGTTQHQDLQTDATTVIRDCEWHDANYVDGDNGPVIYSELVCDYTIIDDGDTGDTGIGGSTGPDYLGSGGGGGGTAADAPPPSNLPGEDDPKIDPKKYMDCFGTVPDAGAKTTVTVYVQEPWPGTTFNLGPNSVGHTCIGLTKTNGNTSITQTVGYYPDASGFAKMHAPSKVLDNGGDLNYNVSMTYSVSTAQFQQIVNYIANPPATYDLTEFNCTNFVYNACKAGNITLPNPYNTVGPSGPGGSEVAMTPAGLGDSIDALKNNPNVNHTGGTTPNSKGSCN
ncbi:hypothetical protein [Mucilaginibacter ginsenosidivorans]|uniref:Uncharacterized protein n=1 Tax=Mucilaginibacter ginsenosidivorans TaxID=398053 RepID=A0A5B8UW44_9SPHI|nr:hypothetical protein [Mucilaginibacter ginsenosidivorans]QEC62551.1 hypothetical protein FRZ54_08090 [Mucilaginibacter ginsenosidivorans]